MGRGGPAVGEGLVKRAISERDALPSVFDIKMYNNKGRVFEQGYGRRSAINFCAAAIISGVLDADLRFCNF